MNQFPTTKWSLIELASGGPGSREQMGILLESYRQPLYTHLMFKGLKHDHAEDMIQEFMLQILNNDLLTIADPQKGKFRTLLLTALDRFLISHHRYQNAAKRSPGAIASLDASEVDQTESVESAPSMAFERAWALDVLAQALAQMKQACDESDQAARWKLFEQRVLKPLLEDADAPDYVELAKECGLANEKAAMNLLVTAKRQFARILRDVVRAYVTRNAEGEVNASSSGRDNAASKYLAEHAVGKLVEDELDQLREILAMSRSVAHMVGASESAAEGDSPKDLFYRRLAQPQQGSEASLEELYERALNGDSVPLDVYFSGVLSADLREFVTTPETDGTLRLLLTCEEPSLATLQAVKDWANLLRAGSGKTLPRDLASGIYYSTIAAALVRCDERITGLPDEGVRRGLSWLAEQSWLEPSLKPTIDEALTRVA